MNFQQQEQLQLKLGLQDLERQEVNQNSPVINVLTSAWNVPEFVKKRGCTNFFRRWKGKFFFSKIEKELFYPGQKSRYIRWENNFFKIKPHKTTWEELQAAEEVFLSFRKTKDMPIGYCLAKVFYPNENCPPLDTP
jgi:hypothetical protein